VKYAKHYVFCMCKTRSVLNTPLIHYDDQPSQMWQSETLTRV